MNKKLKSNSILSLDDLTKQVILTVLAQEFGTAKQKKVSENHLKKISTLRQQEIIDKIQNERGGGKINSATFGRAIKLLNKEGFVTKNKNGIMITEYGYLLSERLIPLIDFFRDYANYLKEHSLIDPSVLEYDEMNLRSLYRAKLVVDKDHEKNVNVNEVKKEIRENPFEVKYKEIIENAADYVLIIKNEASDEMAKNALKLAQKIKKKIKAKKEFDFRYMIHRDSVEDETISENRKKIRKELSLLANEGILERKVLEYVPIAMISSEKAVAICFPRNSDGKPDTDYVFFSQNRPQAIDFARRYFQIKWDDSKTKAWSQD